MGSYKRASYVGYVLYLFSFVLFAYGLVNLEKQLAFDEKGVLAQGMVYNLMAIEPYRRAEVKFKTKTGQSIQFIDKLYWLQDFKAYKKGDKVSVLYDPAAPQKTAMINDFFQRNTEPWWPVIVGCIVFLFGFVLRKIMLKKARAYP